MIYRVACKVSQYWSTSKQICEHCKKQNNFTILHNSVFSKNHLKLDMLNSNFAYCFKIIFSLFSILRIEWQKSICKVLKLLKNLENTALQKLYLNDFIL